MPGSAQKIIAMAEKEMEHRHQREDLLLKQESDRTLKFWRLALISTIFGFASVLILAFLIGFALYIGSDSIAVGTAIGAIAAVAGLFTFGQIMKSKVANNFHSALQENISLFHYSFAVTQDLSSAIYEM